MDNFRPLSRPGLLGRAGPFGLAICLAFGLVPMEPLGEQIGTLLIAALVLIMIVAATLTVDWDNHPPYLQAIPPLAFFAVIPFLRHAEGGAGSGYGLLTLLPILWLALYGTRFQLTLAFVIMILIFAVPIIVLGEPRYPATEWRRVLIWASLGPLVGFTVQRLVTEIRRLVSRLNEVARLDSLTGVPNRRAWDEELTRELSRAQRSGKPVSVAVLDIDNFRAFNDANGHRSGDQFLKDVAAACDEQVKDVDLVARYGDDEFALLLTDCSLDEAHSVVERVRRTALENQTCSVGLACWDGSETGEGLVKRANNVLDVASKAEADRAVLLKLGFYGNSATR
ncbi:MAG: GGDEF domain-containing protein [Actinomycetota bacterium]|nr:GGDEF domain-containing protein [Actinomycetota bacterium]